MAGEVFISHISEESPVALVLQKHLALAFGNDFPIFVSTDKQSIDTGTQWYQEIIKSLKDAKAVVVILSQESQTRTWINFEAGFAVGSDAGVILIRLSRLASSQLGFPLAGLQVLSVDDIPEILEAIAKKVGPIKQQVNVAQYHSDIQEAEAKLNYKLLTVTPVDGQGGLQFDIQNIGNVDLELLMLEILIPEALWDQSSWYVSDVDINHSRVTKDGCSYRWVSLYSPRGAYGNIQPALRPIITPFMGRVRPLPSIPILRKTATPGLERHIFFQIHAVGYNTAMERFDLTW